MKYVHLIFAILSSFRMVELFLLDRVTLRFRNRFPSYLWTCQRCLSVWTGVVATIMFIAYPWFNWPFALSWIYFIHNDWVQAHRLSKQGKQFVITLKPTGQWNIDRNEMNGQELSEILQKLMTPQQQVVNGKAQSGQP
jgi:hypothetical protein